MGVYVKFPDGSMHWDESLPDPSPTGGSVIESGSGRAIPGANRQSGSTGPGGNGVTGSQANPNGGYHAGPSAANPGQPFGSGGFVSGQSGKAPVNPMAPNGSGTPWGDWVANMLGMAGQSPTPSVPAPAGAAAPAPGQQPSTDDWFTAWAQRQAQDVQAQRMAANMQQMPQPFAQSGLSEGRR